MSDEAVREGKKICLVVFCGIGKEDWKCLVQDLWETVRGQRSYDLGNRVDVERE